MSPPNRPQINRNCAHPSAQMKMILCGVSYTLIRAPSERKRLPRGSDALLRILVSPLCIDCAELAICGAQSRRHFSVWLGYHRLRTTTPGVVRQGDDNAVACCRPLQVSVSSRKRPKAARRHRLHSTAGMAALTRVCHNAPASTAPLCDDTAATVAVH